MEVICEDNCGYALGDQNLREGRTRRRKREKQREEIIAQRKLIQDRRKTLLKGFEEFKECR